jgi:toluene monooxygenase system protein B
MRNEKGHTMAIIPLQALFEGDFILLLVPVEDQDTMEVVAQKIAYHVIDRRLPARDAPIQIRYQGAILSQEKTVAEARIGPMAFVEAFYDE